MPNSCREWANNVHILWNVLLRFIPENEAHMALVPFFMVSLRRALQQPQLGPGQRGGHLGKWPVQVAWWRMTLTHGWYIHGLHSGGA